MTKHQSLKCAIFSSEKTGRTRMNLNDHEFHNLLMECYEEDLNYDEVIDITESKKAS